MAKPGFPFRKLLPPINGVELAPQSSTAFFLQEAQKSLQEVQQSLAALQAKPQKPPPPPPPPVQINAVWAAPFAPPKPLPETSLAEEASTSDSTWRPLPLPYLDPFWAPIEPTAGPHHLFQKWHRFRTTKKNLSHLISHLRHTEKPTVKHLETLNRFEKRLRYENANWRRWFDGRYPDPLDREWRGQCCNAAGGTTLFRQLRGWLNAGENLANSCRAAMDAHTRARKTSMSAEGEALLQRGRSSIGRGWQVAQEAESLLWQRYLHLREHPSPPGKADELFITLGTGAVLSSKRLVHNTKREMRWIIQDTGRLVIRRGTELAHVLWEALVLFRLRNPSVPVGEAVALLEELVEERMKAAKYTSDGVEIALYYYARKFFGSEG